MLPFYLHYLTKTREKGIMNISAPAIAMELKFDSTQVVKDLSYTGIKGRPKIGYNIYELIHFIEEYLGFNKVNKAFLVGAGNLGSALMAYQAGQTLGLRILAAFDVLPDKIGTKIGQVNVLDMKNFDEMVKRLGVTIGILTTPENVTQKVADQMIDSGIKAIWNLTPAHLKLPEHIVVQNTSMYSNVAVLLKKLEQSENRHSPLLKNKL
jgi:redox-sensing transcriptional repressor